MRGTYPPFDNRTHTDRQMQTHKQIHQRTHIKIGVPYYSVLGLLVWNITYGAVLKLRSPADWKTIGFSCSSSWRVTQMANQAVATIRSWLSTSGLQRVDHKSETVQFTTKKIVETITSTVGNCNIST